MYEGPLRDEPLAIELHNTLHMAGGRLRDGLAEPVPFLEAIAPRLGPLPSGGWPDPATLTRLRDAIRTALTSPTPEALAAINTAAARAPRAPRAEPDLTRSTEHGPADRAAAVLASFAISAIEIVTGPERDALRTCGAPGCVLMYLQDHPRRRWCSNSCGNRARQARHYARGRR
jgi:CGNR zinc finger/Putative stress-induced transcription regulator